MRQSLLPSGLFCKWETCAQTKWLAQSHPDLWQSRYLNSVPICGPTQKLSLSLFFPLPTTKLLTLPCGHLWWLCPHRGCSQLHTLCSLWNLPAKKATDFINTQLNAKTADTAYSRPKMAHYRFSLLTAKYHKMMSHISKLHPFLWFPSKEDGAYSFQNIC